MKTLKDFLSKVDRPRSDAEVRFIDKHVVHEIPDPDNGDEVFNVSKIKQTEIEKERHGYDADTSADIYEEIEVLDELSKDKLNSYMTKSQLADPKRWRGTKGQKSSNSYLRAADKVAGTGKSRVQATEDLDEGRKADEELNELSKNTLGSYIEKSHENARNTVKRMSNLEKFAKDHKLNVRNTMEGGKNGRRYKDMEHEVQKRDKGISRAVNKLTKEDIINRVIETYGSGTKLTLEDIFTSRLESLSENHQDLLTNLYNSLNETNQLSMRRLMEDESNLPSLIDFALDYKDI